MTCSTWTPIVLASLCATLLAACGDDAPAASDGDAGIGATDGGSSPDAEPVSDAGPHAGTTRVLRDDRGVPHIVGRSLESAMYALGWVHAEDRLFQMSFRRLQMQGRLAEHFAVESPSDEDDRTFNQRLIRDDRRMRTLGFARSAAATVEALSEEHRALLEAYAAGVNAQLVERASLGTAFDEAGIESIEAWSAADSLLAWDSVTYVFGGPFGAIQSEVDRMTACASGECPEPTCSERVIDASAATVPPPADGTWPPTGGGPTACRLGGGPVRPPVDVKASHGFAVAGEHLSSGRPLLFGEPQLMMEAPSTWYEAHVVVPSEGIDVRGVGFAGSPGFLVFFSKNVAQTAMAGGGDTADTFELTLGDTPGTYVVDGVEEPFGRVEETIEVRGADPVELTVETTRFGPVVSDILQGVPRDVRLAMRYAESVRADSHSVIGGIELMRADTLESYRDALRHWVGPTVSVMYAGVDADDGESHIAYHALVGIPRRATLAIGGTDVTGRHPYDGSDSSNDWDGLLDLDWNPHVIDPESGYLINGNSLPVAGWYDDYVYSGIRGNGDTYRSFEIRRALGDLLGGEGPVDADELHALHFDSQSRVVLTLLEALRQMRERGVVDGPGVRDDEVGPAAVGGRVLEALERWEEEGGGVLDQRVVGSLLAARLAGRLVTTSRVDSFACTWGAAEGGVNHFLKVFAEDPSVLGRAEEQAILAAAEAAWSDVVPLLGEDVPAWTGLETPEPFVASYQRIFYCLRPGFDGGCSLTDAHEREMSIARDFTNTISSPHGSSWPVTVDFDDVDRSRALLAPGVSEEPRSPRFFDTAHYIEAKGVGDPASVPLAPLDLERVTVVEELELSDAP